MGSSFAYCLFFGLCYTQATLASWSGYVRTLACKTKARACECVVIALLCHCADVHDL